MDRHGHVFIDVDLNQVQPGMTKEQVAAVLGSPDTTSTIGGDAYYYISTTPRRLPFSSRKRSTARWSPSISTRPRAVQQVAHYGLKDGIVVNYYKGETPARGKDIDMLEQIFGNLANRGMFKDQRPAGPQVGSGIPGM